MSKYVNLKFNKGHTPYLAGMVAHFDAVKEKTKIEHLLKSGIADEYHEELPAKKEDVKQKAVTK